MSSKFQVSIASQLSAIEGLTEEFAENSLHDPLFNSYIWHLTWWELWGEDSTPAINIVSDGAKTLAHLYLYIDKFKFKNILPIKRLQFIGTNYQNFETPRAEYLSFNIYSDNLSVIPKALEKLESIAWDEFVARDIVVGGETAKALTQWATNNRWLSRIIHHDTAYFINTTADFEAYKASLGSSSRLKLFNRRKLLADIGEASIENYYPNRVDEFFKLLDGFHQARWGDSFSSKTVLFHKTIIESCATSNLNVELSVLDVDGVCQSVMFNYILNGRVYNINSGFNERFHKKIAIGMLHFGYLIENSFSDPTIDVFDFLAGHGKNTNYKAKLATGKVELYSLQIVRRLPLILLYKLSDVLKKISKTKLNHRTKSS